MNFCLHNTLFLPEPFFRTIFSILTKQVGYSNLRLNKLSQNFWMVKIMKLSTKTRYGMRAMIDLAFLHEFDEPVTIREIARRNRIPESFLEQLLGTLRKEGLVQSIRGPQGGYILAKEPEEISVSDIINSLEGPIRLAECIEVPLCGEARNCPSRVLWSRIKDSIDEITHTTTLKDLISEYGGSVERKGICND